MIYFFIFLENILKITKGCVLKIRLMVTLSMLGARQNATLHPLTLTHTRVFVSSVLNGTWQGPARITSHRQTPRAPGS